MPLVDLIGHAEARDMLAGAMARDRLPQSLLVHGPPGIGKERFGLWIAQMLLCTERDPGGSEPCDACRACRLVRRLEHPDLHWFFPLPRPKASSPEKLREKLEDLRADELRTRRADPLHVPVFERAPAYFIATIRTIQQLASVRPAMGGRTVFLLGDVEAMVPQEASQEAANAFLKLLEEPPPDMTLLLTTARPGALLPTVLSRVLPVRLRALGTEEVAEFLETHAGEDSGAAAAIAERSDGAVGRALRLRSADGESGALEEQRRAGRALMEAALAHSPADGYAAAHARAAFGGRSDDFQGELDALGGWLRDLLAVSSGGLEDVRNRDGADMLQRAVAEHGVYPRGVWLALNRLEQARALAAGNVNPQLITADLVRGIRADLRM